MVGLQCGDEGKGKVVDYYTTYNLGVAPIVARVNGGPNAGHTVVVNNGEENIKYAFHLLPSGLLRADAQGVLGPGVCVNLSSLNAEIEVLEDQAMVYTGFNLKIRSRLHVDARCPLILNIYKVQDAWREDQRVAHGQAILGTTKQGMGPVVSWHALREGVRVGDVLSATFPTQFRHLCDLVRTECPGLLYSTMDEDEELHQLQTIAATLQISNAVDFVHQQIRQCNTNIIIEIANGAMLSPRYGTYPHCTSTIVDVAAVLDGLGLTLEDRCQASVMGVKAYTTAVGTPHYSNGAAPRFK